MTSAHDSGLGGDTGLRLDSARGRWLLVMTILGSGMAGIDATIVNVALPQIGRSFKTSFTTLQWVVTGYALTLAAFILLGGVLGDRLGRLRVFVIGVVWFTVASLACGLAPTAGTLVAARALQGIGGALLTPGSLALLQSAFAREDRSRAIGTWAGLGGVAMAVGPFVGGWLVEVASWRWVFLINLPVAAVVLLIARGLPPFARPVGRPPRLDVLGAGLGVLALAGATYALTEIGGGELSPFAIGAAAVGGIGTAAFIRHEHRTAHPMLPLTIFASRTFTTVNAVTFLVYGGMGVVFLLLVLQLQVVAGWSPLASGIASLPTTAMMMLGSSRSGVLADRIGPRLQMGAGPLVMAAGILLLLRIGTDTDYVLDVLPGVLVFGLGLTALVAPLTSTALASAPDEYAGLASGVNNAVARTGGLIGIAAVPALAGLTGQIVEDPAAFDDGFRVAMLTCAVVIAAGGALAATVLRGRTVGE
ncbi:MFS transporter [Janibacter sp. Soil728]|uniref:MFS transporter n=1 Tax=Janibacter sp. Soil728 TaxID=1736393 RepID=UPI0006F2ECE7|nr:MFS transporter [Janibacter sp. Soil728]KRE38614.1 MFS transporter [Janibacter sp. Soil728]